MGQVHFGEQVFYRFITCIEKTFMLFSAVARGGAGGGGAPPIIMDEKKS